MKKIKLFCLPIYNFKKKFFLIILMAIFLSILMNIFVNNIFVNFHDHNFPNNLAYVKDDDFSLEVKKQLDDAQIPYNKNISIKDNKYAADDFYYPYNVNDYIDVLALDYSGDTTKGMILNTQNLLKTGVSVINIQVVYNINSDIYLKNKLDVTNDQYNVESILEGYFPDSENEIMIGEGLANKILNEKKLNNYKDLIGLNLKLPVKDCGNLCLKDSYKISGIYDALNEEGEELEIINPDPKYYEEFQDIDGLDYDYLIQFEDKKQREEFTKNNSLINILSSKDFQEVNFKHIFVIFYICLLNILVFFLLYKEITEQNKTLKAYKYNLFWRTYSFLILFIVVNIIIFMFLNV